MSWDSDVRSGRSSGSCTDVGGVGVEYHEAKLLRADAAEEDVEGVLGGHDAVEEGDPLLAGVARTPAVVLGPWRTDRQQRK